MARVLVVGGAGYVGSVLVRELLERGYLVRVLDRLYFGDQGLRDIADRIELVQGDMRTLDVSVLNGVSAVANVGGLSNDPTAEYNPQANYEMNTLATETLARACKEHGVDRYVFASSCSIYDQGVRKDSADVLLDESSPVDPRSAYSGSKYEAEKRLLALADERFCPVILRKGTIFGFSPRMRYDLVVNTFVKEALSRSYFTLFYGGQMWRPLVEVRDAARAYIACLEAEPTKVRGEIFNLVYRNFRISEVGLHVREALRVAGVHAEIRVDYHYRGVRSYRVSGRKIESVLNLTPSISLEESVADMVEKIQEKGYTDFDHPRYYNIRWLQLLEEAQHIISATGSVLGAPGGVEQAEEKVLRFPESWTEERALRG